MSRLLTDHGTAERLPPMDDAKGWAGFRVFLGSVGQPEMQADGLMVTTASGRILARPGDWLIRTAGAGLHIGRSDDRK